MRVQAHDRKRLEQLCRYITRPSLSDERVQLNAAGQVELKLKTPWRDGTTHLVMAPLPRSATISLPQSALLGWPRSSRRASGGVWPAQHVTAPAPRNATAARPPMTPSLPETHH
ncbi:MAG: transposase [Betaproteobacteria bacterium]